MKLQYYQYRESHYEIRRSRNRLIFIMGYTQIDCPFILIAQILLTNTTTEGTFSSSNFKLGPEF